MAYARYLDVHIMDSFTRLTFSADAVDQEAHQVGKKVEYRKYGVLPLSINRQVPMDELKGHLKWLCEATGAGGKMRINAHGDTVALSNNTGGKVDIQALADFLKLNGLAASNMAKPGLRTINLALCDGATGPQDKWMIKRLGDALAIPGLKVTGAPGVTTMVKGVLQVKHDPMVHPKTGKYVVPQRRPARADAVTDVKHSFFKKEYTYQEKK